MDWTKKVGRKQVGRKLGARLASYIQHMMHYTGHMMHYTDHIYIGYLQILLNNNRI